MRYVHLSYEDRTTIERCSKEGRSFKETGQIIGKSPSTVTKEIKKHRRAKSRNTAYEPNNCKHMRECIKNEHCQHKCCDRSDAISAASVSNTAMIMSLWYVQNL